MAEFILYPALDLRAGRVVRLKEGDPERETHYADDPGATAARWLAAGARWLHVVNLDGAFEQPDGENLKALGAILQEAKRTDAQVQFGGGLRTMKALSTVIELGVTRAILGTAALEQPKLVDEALARWGAERVAASLDARDGLVRVRGWQESSTIHATTLAKELAERGLRWLIYTDIARDGLQSGLNIAATVDVARASGLEVIASGGLRGWNDIETACQAGLAGAITGRALYEGVFDAEALFAYRCERKAC